MNNLYHHFDHFLLIITYKINFLKLFKSFNQDSATLSLSPSTQSFVISTNISTNVKH